MDVNAYPRSGPSTIPDPNSPNREARQVLAGLRPSGPRRYIRRSATICRGPAPQQMTGMSPSSDHTASRRPEPLRPPSSGSRKGPGPISLPPTPAHNSTMRELSSSPLAPPLTFVISPSTADGRSWSRASRNEGTRSTGASRSFARSGNGDRPGARRCPCRAAAIRFATTSAAGMAMTIAVSEMTGSSATTARDGRPELTDPRMTNHLADTALGRSYSIWTKPGGRQYGCAADSPSCPDHDTGPARPGWLVAAAAGRSWMGLQRSSVMPHASQLGLGLARAGVHIARHPRRSRCGIPGWRA
jgi:hypothetical protein